MAKKLLTVMALGAGMLLPSAVEAAAQPKEVNLRFSWWGGEDRHKRTLEAIKLFEQKYPHIKVKGEYGGWQGHQDKVTTQIVGNTAPDMLQINWNWINLFSRRGTGFYDLFKQKDIIDLNNYDKDILDQTIVDGKLNAIPIGLTGRTFYYNKTTYDKAGLPVPKSFADLRAAAPVFKEKLGNDYYPMDIDSYGAFLFMIYKLEEETGKPFIVNDQVAYTKDQMVDAAKFYTTLVKEGVLPSLSTRAAAGNIPLDQHPSWIQGKYAGTYEWDSAAPKWQDSLEKGQELVVGDFPKDFGPHKAAFFKVSMAYAINKNEKNPKETAQLLEFMVADPEATKVLGLSRGVPANKAALKTLEEAGMAKGLVFQANEKVMAFAGKGIHPLFEHPKLNKNLRDLVDQLGYGEINEEQFGEKVVSETNTFLNTEMKKK